MSKIGTKPVEITQNVQVTITHDDVTATGALGTLAIPIPRGIRVKEVEGKILVERTAEDKKHKALHGLVRSLIQNAVDGVTTSWKRSLEIVGTGYKVRLQGSDLIFDIGYSHPVTFPKQEGITFEVDGGRKIVVSGIDKQKVGEVAFKIKSIRKPDPYKGKGVRYEGEVIKLKPGKKAKTG